MRTSTVIAAFLLVGAGAATLAAVEPGGGNNLALTGSGELFEVTKSVMSACGGPFPTFESTNTSYLGGGSGVGAGRMALGLQEISPMDRALTSSEYCAPGPTAAAEGAAPSNAQALLVGIDGVSITANQTNSCVNDPTANPSGAAVGLGAPSFQVTVPPCHGCSGTTYTLGDPAGSLYRNQPSFDALAIIYFGLTHDGFYDCSGNVRRALVANWSALFNISCAASGTGLGTGNCPNGLQHAWRPGDLTGTADGFVSVLNPPNGTFSNGKNGNLSVGIGTLSNLPSGATQRSNPFCNSADATSSPATVSFGGASDFSDQDPIRTVCTPADDICEGFQAGGATSRFKGDLGLVLPILYPDGPFEIFQDIYPGPPCGPICAMIPIAKSNLVGNTLCPNGQLSYAGSCFVPTIAGSNPPDPRCFAAPFQTCIDTVGRRDGRTFNLVTYVESPAVLDNRRAGGLFQWAFDANNRLLAGSFYRVRSTVAADPNNTGTGICQETDATHQIGCLTDSNPCSIGYAGRPSSATFPDNSLFLTIAPLKALAINAGAGFVPPFTPASVSSDQDLFLENLLTVGANTYPLARRLYLSTTYGYGHLGGGELELAKCFATNAFTNPAIVSSGFVPIPANNRVGTPGVECVDYVENGTNASSPMPTVQGPGAVAFPGCNDPTITTNTDACAAASSRPVDIFGNLIPESL